MHGAQRSRARRTRRAVVHNCPTPRPGGRISCTLSHATSHHLPSITFPCASVFFGYCVCVAGWRLPPGGHCSMAPVPTFQCSRWQYRPAYARRRQRSCSLRHGNGTRPAAAPRHTYRHTYIHERPRGTLSCVHLDSQISSTLVAHQRKSRTCIKCRRPENSRRFLPHLCAYSQQRCGRNARHGGW